MIRADLGSERANRNQAKVFFCLGALGFLALSFFLGDSPNALIIGPVFVLATMCWVELVVGGERWLKSLAVVVVGATVLAMPFVGQAWLMVVLGVVKVVAAVASYRALM